MKSEFTAEKIPFKNRVILALTRAAGLAATAAAIAASLNSQAAPVEKKLVGLEIEISRWLPNVSAALNSKIDPSGRIEGVSVSSVFGSQAYSLEYVRAGMVVPDFNGERLLGFGVASNFDAKVGGEVKLVFKAASSVGGGCRQLNVITYKKASDTRLYAYNPFTRQPLTKIKISAPEDTSGHRAIQDLELTDVTGKTEDVGISRLQVVRCPW